MSDNFLYFRASPRKRFQAPGLQANVLRLLLSALLLTTYASSLNAATVTWDAETDNQWSGTGDATSWSGETYNDGDKVQFLGDGAGTVDITATVSPESITVNAETNYLFSGEGSIASGTVNKAGSGMLTLSGNHSYTGTTSIAAGMLVVQSRYSLGTTNGATTVASGATLELNHVPANNASPIEENLTLNGAGVNGTEGALKVTATGAGAELSSAITLGSDATINTQARFDTNSTITDNGNGYTLTKTGSNYS